MAEQAAGPDDLIAPERDWMQDCDVAPNVEQMKHALEFASQCAGLIPAATSVAEFFERLSEHVTLSADDEDWFVSDAEAAQLLVEPPAAKPEHADAPPPDARGNGFVRCAVAITQTFTGATLRLSEIRDVLVDNVGDDAASTVHIGELWDQHLAVNQGAPSLDSDETHLVQLNGLPHGLKGLFERHLVRAVDSLGPNLAGALFTGPEVNTVIVARDAHVDQVDQIFTVFHMVMHGLLGHVRRAFDYRLEFARGMDPRGLRALTGYIDQEQDADDAATCMMTEGYSDSVFLKAFASQTRTNGELSKSEIRAALHNRHKVLYAIVRRLQVVTPSALHALLDPPTVYTGTIGIATAPGYPLYLLQRVDVGDSTMTLRRWIPSRKVLQALGAENLPTDVVIKKPNEILDLPEGPMLINPLEVATARRYLLDTAAQLSIGPGAARDRLAGLSNPKLPQAAGLWPVANVAVPMPSMAPRSSSLWPISDRSPLDRGGTTATS